MPKRDTGLKVFPDHNIVSFSDVIDKKEINIRVCRCPKAFDSAPYERMFEIWYNFGINQK